jgi:hypothetical protein
MRQFLFFSCHAYQGPLTANELELVGDDVAARFNAHVLAWTWFELHFGLWIVFMSTQQPSLRTRKHCPGCICFVSLAHPLFLCDLYAFGFVFGLGFAQAKPDHTILVLAAADAVCLGKCVLVDEIADLRR